uniref:Si:dkey-19b23.7 n=1 Tax=Lepisosteus oculatus TaxID=7918 RepID=W5N996_LEPOC
MSTDNNQEMEQKRRLQPFLTDLATLGSLQGFRYFQPWLRGREELLLTVVNEDLGWRSPGFPGSMASSPGSSSSSSTSSSGNAGDLSRDEQALLLSNRWVTPASLIPQHFLAIRINIMQPWHILKWISEGYLLPASPSDREIAVPQEMNCTLFLLAGYAKYGRPYAWIRSNHERLVNIGGADSFVRDTPMKLKSIAEWSTHGTRVWDMVSELVTLCTTPAPINPFALDLRYLERLPLAERFLGSGA